MKKLLSISLIWGIFLSACKKHENPWYIPGEWEAQEAIWLGWEHRPTVMGYHKAIFELIESIHHKVGITIVSPNDSISAVAQHILASRDLPIHDFRFVSIPDNRYWIRDHGPTFLVNDKQEQAIANFDWSLHDHAVGKVDERAAEILGLPIIDVPLVIEGGGMESNGKGTLLLVESHMLQRNPGKTLIEIDSIFQSTLGIKKIIWLPSGLANDPLGLAEITPGFYGYGVGGHIDEFARFVDPSTIVLAWIGEEEAKSHPIYAKSAEALQQAYEILHKATDQDGNPLNIKKIPLPDLLHKAMIVTDQDAAFTDSTLGISLFGEQPSVRRGDTLHFVAAASYNNFLLTNESVILPTYIPAGSSKQKEEEVANTFSQLFPSRELIFIDCMYQNYRGGGIHCSTKQQVKKKMKIFP